jgi:hypothetical protein
MNLAYTPKKDSIVKKPFINQTQRSWIDKLIIFSLVSGIICFGFILPDSISDHTKLVHFAAHFGMSFLILSCSYAFCSLQWHISRSGSYGLAILATLAFGSAYKYWEIASQGISQHFEFGQLLTITGVYTSMSQNLSGIFAALLIIHYFFGRRVVLVRIDDQSITERRAA